MSDGGDPFAGISDPFEPRPLSRQTSPEPEETPKYRPGPKSKKAKLLMTSTSPKPTPPPPAASMPPPFRDETLDDDEEVYRRRRHFASKGPLI